MFRLVLRKEYCRVDAVVMGFEEGGNGYCEARSF